MSDKICVLGGGSWGATVASHLAKKGLNVSLWEFAEAQVEQMRKTRSLSFLPQLRIPESVFITSRMDEALKDASVVFSIVPSQFVRSTWAAAKKCSPKPELVVTLSKGIENSTLMTMTQVIESELPAAKGRTVVVSGPSHAEEVAMEIPTAVVAASDRRSLAERAQKLLGTTNFRVYTNPDATGVEIAGSLKNIFAIACGACDGLGMGDNTKSALITRGLNEMAKLGVRMGGREETFFGLAGMGDLVVTCFSKHSRNRLLGEKVGQGKSAAEALKEMTMIAEGYPTSKSAYDLVKKHGADCPIIVEIYRVLYEGKSIRESVHDLLARPMHGETDALKWKAD